MPHPEHAVDPLTGSTDGLKLFAGMATALASDAADRPRRRPGRRARADARRVRAGRATSSAASPTRSSWRCSRCCGASTAPTSTRRSCCARCRPRARSSSWAPGENAGAVDVGGGWAVAFKVESHNHPSAVEPFQGAATGVGGILRDIFAIGARPIAVLDSLRFGEPTSERSRYLLDRAVAGIGHYGNSVGVPTIGGEVYFEAPYEQNCLINAMALGLGRDRRPRALGRGRRRQPGDPVRRVDRPRRDRRRVGARVGRARRCRRRQAPVGPGRRPVRRVQADRVLAGAAGAQGCSCRCRTSARPG